MAINQHRRMTCRCSAAYRLIASRYKAHGVWLAIFLIVGVLLPSMGAQNHGVPLTQFGHTSWRSAESDFPGSLQAIGQTADGYLWIGTSDGLLRYDGQSFSPQKDPRLLHANVLVLTAAADGGLWLGLRSGLLYVQGQTVRRFDGDAETLAVVPQGKNSAWVQHPGHLDLCEASSQSCSPVTTPLPITGTRAIFSDGRRGFWQCAGLRLYHWDGASGYTYSFPSTGSADSYATITALQPAIDGSLWLGVSGLPARRGIFQLNHGRFSKVPMPSKRSLDPFVTTGLSRTDGSFWFGSEEFGLFQLHGGRLDRYDVAEGLSGSNVRTLFEDREGTIWVITNKGIDKFRQLPIRTWQPEEVYVGSVAVLRDGTLVSGSHALDFWHPDDSKPFLTLHRKGLFGIPCVLVDHRGRLLVAWNDAIYVWDHNTLRLLFHTGDPTKRMILSLTEGPDHTIWARGASRLPAWRTIFKIRDDKVVAEIPRTGDLTGAGLAGAPGGFWFSNAAGEIGRYLNGQVHVWHRSPSGMHTTTASLTVLPDGAVMTPEDNGLLLFDQERYKVLGTQNGLPCAALHSAVMDGAGDVWATASCGLIRIHSSDLKRWLTQPSIRIPVEQFGTSDEVGPTDGATNTQMAVSPTGQIWFATESGLQMIDPARLQQRIVSPASVIEEVIADRTSMNVQQHLSLPAKTADIEIRYAALSFDRPERIRFQYRLDGWNREWMDAGVRRAAFFTNLRPGEYTFHVRASKGMEDWGEEQNFAFRVKAAWYQTIWFRLSAMLCTFAMLWLFYVWRIRAVEQRASGRLAERMRERTRLARDLHDTLLQTVQGSRMIVENARDMNDPAGMRKALDRASHFLEQAVQEGRDALNALRNDDLGDRTLEDHLRSIAETVTGNAGLVVPLTFSGDMQEVKPEIRAEIGVILGEALRNTVQHAQASVAHVSIEYAEAFLKVSVRDNGIGVESSILQFGKAGHFGLHSMRERATAIRAKLAIHSEPSTGTTIDLTVPAAIAYSSRLWNLVQSARSLFGL